MSETHTPLGDMADQILSADGDEDGEIAVGDVVHILGSRSHYALLLAVSATCATPLSGIPGVSVVCGLLIALIAAERIFLRHRDVYLPGKLSRRAISAEKAQGTIKKIRPYIDWVDRHTRKRFSGLFKAPMIYVPLTICMISGAAMPFLEFIPFTSSIVASGVLLISVGLVTRDGIFAVLSIIPYIGLVVLLTRVVG
ncbi:exopolysaccharide biosynthesis protein [Cribrihabitans sp. XS_ASV171]